MLAINSMQLQKEVKSNPSCKKKCEAPKKAIVKKDVKSKVVTKKWLDSWLMAKNLIMTIQVNLVPNPSEATPNSLELLLLKFLLLTYHQAISWPPLGFHIFFHYGLLGGCTLFYSWAVLD